MPKKKARSGWGGRRRKAGRPKGSGKPASEVRDQRVPVMLREEDMKELYRIAEEEQEPPATVAYKLFEDGLKRRRRKKKKKQ